jgi:uncharacterized membrane protein YczE
VVLVALGVLLYLHAHIRELSLQRLLSYLRGLLNYDVLWLDIVLKLIVVFLKHIDFSHGLNDYMSWSASCLKVTEQCVSSVE